MQLQTELQIDRSNYDYIAYNYLNEYSVYCSFDILVNCRMVFLHGLLQKCAGIEKEKLV